MVGHRLCWQDYNFDAVFDELLRLDFMSFLLTAWSRDLMPKREDMIEWSVSISGSAVENPWGFEVPSADCVDEPWPGTTAKRTSSLTAVD